MSRIILKLVLTLGFVGLTLVPGIRSLPARPQTLAFHRYPHAFTHTTMARHIGSQPMKIGVTVTGAFEEPRVTAALHVRPRQISSAEVSRTTLRPSTAGDTVFFTGTISAYAPGTGIDYWIEMTDSTGRRLGGFGLPEDGALSVIFAAPVPRGLRLAFDVVLRLAIFLAALAVANALFPKKGEAGLREKEHRQIRLTMILLVVFVFPLSMLISYTTFGRVWTGWSPAIFWMQKGCLLAAMYWLFLALKSRRMISGKQPRVRFTRRRLPLAYILLGLLMTAAIALLAPS